MPRPRQRVCLQDGLKLDLNRLIRQGFARPGAKLGPHVIQWSNSYTGEFVASGEITADLSGRDEGWFRFRCNRFDQWIIMVPRLRHFGGRQWYFMCPDMNRRASVLWLPPGATRFCSRQAWGRQVAYSSQFKDWVNRAHHGKDRIKRRLCDIGGFDPDEWDLPPKPKWMRWRTYDRVVKKFDRYETMLDQGCLAAVLKLTKLGFWSK